MNKKAIKNLEVPTGNILIVEGFNGMLECLSIGDYGKEANIKADFLGLREEINGVTAARIMPLSEKWVITISTQYGCSMDCKFCDVPKVGPGRNAILDDLTTQLVNCLQLHPEIEATKRLNVHYARMGEPTFNFHVPDHASQLHSIIRPYIGNSLVHPVVSTMLPRSNRRLVEFLQCWCDIKNYTYRGDAGLQLSINSTDDNQRNELFSGNSLSLAEISDIGKLLPDPAGRKYALNFAMANDTIVDGSTLRKLFSPEKFMCKITPIHETFTSKENGITTSGGYEHYYPYKKAEDSLKSAGFDVLVFIPSKDEDESRITCGNAILSDKQNYQSTKN
jgi:23S rRNA (adenine2503-C2)-methyltransferase